MRKIFIILALAVFLSLTFVSAFEFDNIKSYNEKTKTITIKNAFGLGKDLAWYKLESNTAQCLINCESTGTAYLFFDNKLFQSLKLKDTNNQITNIKKIQIYIWIEEEYEIDVPDYKCILINEIIGICEQYEIIGYHKETRREEYWKKYRGEILSIGEYKWKLKGNKEIKQEVDWILSSNGVELDNWAWWNSSWLRKKEINITEMTGSNLINYSLKLEIDYENFMNSSFEDLRFVNASEDSELYYWIENYNLNINVTVWVMIPELTASQNTTIYMYYGNNEAETTSNKNDTFLLWDDFLGSNIDTTKWRVLDLGPGSVTVANSEVTLQTGESAGCEVIILEGKEKFGYPLEIEYNASLEGSTGATGGGSYTYGFVNNVSSASVTDMVGQYDGGANNKYLRTTASSSTTDISWAYTSDSFKIFKFLWNQTNVTAFENDVYGINSTSNIPIVDLFFQSQAGQCTGNEDVTLIMDYIRVRRWASIEPDYFLSSEEGYGVTTIFDSPEDFYNSSSLTLSINFIVNSSAGSLSTLANTTLYIWNSTNDLVYNETNSSYSTNNQTTYSYIFPYADTYKWNALTYDTTGTYFDWEDENRTLTILGFIENSQTYNENTTEGNTETFEINITYDNSFYPNINGNLIYNGTSYSGTAVGSGDTITFTTEITIPNINIDTNLTFYWEIILIKDTYNYFNSTFHNQTVFNINIDNCSINTNIIYNFTIVDEENQDLIPINNSIEIFVNIYSLDRNILISNYSGDFNTSSIDICINRNLSNFTSRYSLDSTVKYSAQDHEIEYYNIINYSLNNQSEVQNIILYDLLTSDSTEFQLTFTGSDFLPVENALVFVKRQYVSENLFKTVELPKTDSNGQTILHLVKNDIVYNIEIMKDEIVVGNFENMIAFCEDIVIGNCKITLSAAESGEAIFSYDNDLGITYTGPTYNNATRIITFNFLTTDSSVKTVLMNATRNDIFGNISICSASIVSSGGTLNCEVPSYIEDSLIITKVFVDGKETLKDYTVLSEFNYGKAGYFIFFIYMLAFIFMFSKSKTTMLIGIIVGFIVGITLGLISGKLVGIGASGIWLIIIVILMIWKLNKGRPD